MMTIKEMLQITPFENIAVKIALHYGIKEIEQYQQLYNRLILDTSSSASDKKLCIFITAYQYNEDDDLVCVDSFDEDNITLHFDVSAYTDVDDIVYSISSISKSDFLRCSIDKRTLDCYTHATILAHCFWEITCYSFM